MENKEWLRVTDDSGFLAVVVPAAYESFVNTEWALDELFRHFSVEMGRRALLIWGTGLEGTWRVEVRTRRFEGKGFREVSGPLEVRGGAVLVTICGWLLMRPRLMQPIGRWCIAMWSGRGLRCDREP